LADKHADRELRIFSSFLVAAGLPVEANSVEKRKPPDPDILCVMSGKGSIAFELVELVDPDFAERIGLMFKTKTMLQKCFENLPETNRRHFESKYNNALLHFRFRDKTSLRNRQKSLEAAYKHLLTLDADFEGQTYHDQDQGKILRSVIIRRGEFVGPVLDPESVGSVGDPTWDTLQKKLNKKYATDHPVELLAYIDIHPMLPDNIWLPQVSDFVKTSVDTSKFRRIWIYDVHKNSIRYKYPG